jgi:hypothetical protein
MKKEERKFIKAPKLAIFLFTFLSLPGLFFVPAGMYAATSISFTGGELLGKSPCPKILQGA